jgi:5-methylcytosine-specific restriction endonuclease McrA
MKLFCEFSPSSRGKLGLSAYCRECTNKRPRNLSDTRACTKRYREVNRERYLSAHRVHQFERKTRIKVTQDGSITDELLKDLYARTNCYYCGLFTESDKRTLDHKVSLARGGTHTANNVEMACWSCNCSKRDLSESEFKEKLNGIRSENYCGFNIAGGKENNNNAIEVLEGNS